MPITGRISRTRRDGRPLRISDEVIHLAPLLGNETQSLEKDYINEAQISIMFTGVDDFYWTSYCFVDQYFQDEDHSEQVQCLAETLSDPHSGGRHLSDPPLWNPRHFFLRTLSFRLSQVKEEWTNTVNNLMAEIRPWVGLQNQLKTAANNSRYMLLHEVRQVVPKSLSSLDLSGSWVYYEITRSPYQKQSNLGKASNKGRLDTSYCRRQTLILKYLGRRFWST